MISLKADQEQDIFNPFLETFLCTLLAYLISLCSKDYIQAFEFGADVLLMTTSAVRSRPMESDIPETVKHGFKEKGVHLGFCILLDCSTYKQFHLSPQMAQTQHKCTHSSASHL